MGQVLTLTACLSEAIVHADLILCHFSGLALVCLMVWLQLHCYHRYMIFIHFCCLFLIAPGRAIGDRHFYGYISSWSTTTVVKWYTDYVSYSFTCFLMQIICCQIALAITGHSSKYHEENTKGNFMFPHR